MLQCRFDIKYMKEKAMNFCNFHKDFRSSSLLDEDSNDDVIGKKVSATIEKTLIASDKALPYKFNEFRHIYDAIYVYIT